MLAAETVVATGSADTLETTVVAAQGALGGEATALAAEAGLAMETDLTMGADPRSREETDT
jgi:hypothetical protein